MNLAGLTARSRKPGAVFYLTFIMRAVYIFLVPSARAVWPRACRSASTAAHALVAPGFSTSAALSSCRALAASLIVPAAILASSMESSFAPSGIVCEVISVGLADCRRPDGRFRFLPIQELLSRMRFSASTPRPGSSPWASDHSAGARPAHAMAGLRCSIAPAELSPHGRRRGPGWLKRCSK